MSSGPDVGGSVLMFIAVGALDADAGAGAGADAGTSPTAKTVW